MKIMKEKQISDILHSYEKIPAEICPDSYCASRQIADIISERINSAHGLFKLGLSTGNTPVSLFRELAERCRKGQLSFRDVEIFSIDEYYPTTAGSPQSRNVRLHEDFLSHVDVRPENVHIPDGSVPSSQLTDYCATFDALHALR